MKEAEVRLKEQAFLDRYVFVGLTNLNNGFDAPSIKYFSASEFEIVLKRVQQLGLGVYGIEPWKNGEYYWVVVYEAVTDDPKDSTWYWKAFEDFKEDGEELQFAATYHIPEDLLDGDWK